jgi:hypothetical protein
MKKSRYISTRTKPLNPEYKCQAFIFNDLDKAKAHLKGCGKVEVKLKKGLKVVFEQTLEDFKKSKEKE